MLMTNITVAYSLLPSFTFIQSDLQSGLLRAKYSH